MLKGISKSLERILGSKIEYLESNQTETQNLLSIAYPTNQNQEKQKYNLRPCRYIGHTNDLDRRLAEHNDPYYTRSTFTKRSKGEWRLLHSEEYSTRSEAVLRERALKSGRGREWIHRILLKEADKS